MAAASRLFQVTSHEENKFILTILIVLLPSALIDVMQE
jgi:hypothetical protein